MAGKWESQQGLPPGWEAKLDERTGRYYFLDHTTRQTTWEDPRLRSYPPPPPYPGDAYGQKEPIKTSATPQPPWMSPYLGGRSAAGYPNFAGYGLGIPGQQTLYASVLQDVTNTASGAPTFKPPIQPILGSGRIPVLQDCKEEVEFSIKKISVMFPTVPENLIRDLMRKYHNREAVVISAIQVQKFPLSNQTPLTSFTPPPSRHFIPTASALLALQHGLRSQQDSAIPSAPPQLPSDAAPSVSSTITTTTTQAPTTFPHTSLYERTSGTHLLQEERSSTAQEERSSYARGSIPGPRSSMGEPSVGSPGICRSSMERSFGSPKPGRDSPLFWSRTSSPRTTRSVSDVTRSFMGSPRPDFRQSPRPSPHSPKIKLRYLKGLFPKVDPTELLDVLTSNCYNVKDACEELVKRGHSKKDISMTPPKLKERKNEENLKEQVKEIAKPSPAILRPKNLTEEYKKNVRSRLGSEFPVLTPTVVNMALQSGFFDEERARQILKQMNENEKKAQETLALITPKTSKRSETPPAPIPGASPPRARREGRTVRPVLHRPRVNMAWTNSATMVPSRSSSSELDDSSFKSKTCLQAKGPNASFHSGPCDALLLTDYVPWHGPNVDNLIGESKFLANGPNAALRKGPSNLAKGPNPSFRKGPAGIARGSQFIANMTNENSFSTKRL